MNTPDTTHDETNHAADAHVAAAEPVHAHASEDRAAGASHDAARHEGDEGDDGDHDGEGEEGGEEASADGAPALNEDGTPKAKKKRRRKKKKPGAAMLNADGTPMLNADGTPMMAATLHEGSHQGQGQGQGQGQQRRGPRPPVDRERIPFNVGDIVFGKVLEAKDHCLLIDLSGKAIGIFDLKELLIPEEEIKEIEEAHAADEAEEAAHVAGVAAASLEGEAVDVDAAAAAEGESAEQTEERTRRLVVATEVAEELQAEAQARAENPPAPMAEEPVLPRVALEPGSQFVGVVHNDGGRGGLVVLTHHPKRASKAKPLVSQAMKDGTEVMGLVTGTIKGGVEVDVDGLRAFAPASHMDARMGADLRRYVGELLEFKVTQYGKRGRDVVLSRRERVEAEAGALREEALKNINVGDVIEGTVRTVVTFGAFIDLGGIEGLVPLSEMSHNRGDRPNDIFKVGQKINVKLLQIDEKGKLWLSSRACMEDPWGAVSAQYPVGTKLMAKVVRTQPFGVFMELAPGVDGLIHAPDLSINNFEHPDEIVKMGQEIEVVVASLDANHHRIGLHPTLQGDAAAEEPQRIQKDKVVKVKVIAAEATGLKVRVMGVTGRYARGFVPPGGTGTPRGTDLKKQFPAGSVLDAKVLDVDARFGEVKLSVKAVGEDTERNAFQAYRQQVKREAKFGTFGDLLQKTLKPQP